MSAGKKVVQVAVYVTGVAIGISLYHQISGAAALPVASVSPSNTASQNHKKAVATAR